eukprot:CAMPEP_0206137602 /NCGR_PEP_ID=MMETSP1473-20131121/2699_1 /ASSEMBLY_ACC=CAM_ASM_001109 /TAXON_ID=1461547 /ORGANISM="Stichococcus sp, Strain RCC1054" /LENGTH=91 /DNA_ID=CAMNT_0053530775 /DNA_START=199 /DNA_END=474 /DNA_ORIENTATION=-
MRHIGKPQRQQHHARPSTAAGQLRALAWSWRRLGGGGRVLRGGGHALTEAILEAPVDSLQVPHAASAGGLPPNCLHGPVVFPDTGGGVAAR